MPQLHVFLSDDDQKRLKDNSQASGLSISTYIRCLIRGRTVRPKPPEQYAKLLQELSAAGNNINQIARVANSCGYVRQEDIEQVKDMQSRLWSMIKNM